MDVQFSYRDEAQMIASILAGDTEQYHELIRPYEHSVYKMALSLMKNQADAEDVAQESFLKALRKLADFRGQAKFSTWLISITLNEARGRLRRQGIDRSHTYDSLEDRPKAYRSPDHRSPQQRFRSTPRSWKLPRTYVCRCGSWIGRRSNTCNWIQSTRLYA